MDLYDEISEIKRKQDKTLALLEDLRNGVVNNKDRLYDLTDLEQLLKTSRRTLFKHLSSGVLEHSKVGKKIFISEEQLRKFLKSNSQNY